ncbi:hypothetical protein J7384_03050 [Endozoicomonas sp. G2_1]|uniref:alpha-amylase family glycosyl hydrolase n=1 Tax=Endozoicomonas sp. G2_1 TaxID=2821091 RepID=UPI001ADBD56A|nr:alpha-amylase family glycosyl hydrolase [Endozoicomonas sp. G2_1]MBO9489331.1 hypothetical protein [Endozoicomonas sp. G2_1]
MTNLATKFVTGLSPIVLAMALSACGTDKEQVAESASSPIMTQAATAVKGKASELAPYQERDFKDEVFYFVLPDRFYNADKSNDLGAKADDSKRALSRGGLDVTHKGMFHGGDLAGLTEKLPYLDNMGVTAIWLTPVLRNKAMQAGTSGYHGYWILDFTEIDPHLGSNTELKQFIDQAHQRNIKVFFDIITNHTADVIKYKECHGDDGLGWLVEGNSCPFKPKANLENDSYTALIPAGEEAVKYPNWLNDIKYYHNQGDSFWQGESSVRGDFSGLDDVDTNNAEVVDGMIDIYKDIISEFKPDGFRIDTVKHVNMEFWQAFSPALMSHAQAQGISNFVMFGEAYSFEPEFLSQFMKQGQLPAVLDFALQGAIEKALVDQKGTDVLAELFAQDSFYQTDRGFDANYLVNFTGNHDMGRIAGKLKQSEHGYDEQAMIDRTLLAHALIYFSRGVPVIYYGDEQGFVGDGGDQDSRQNMMPSMVATYNDDDLLATDKTTADDNFDVNHSFYQIFSEFAALYQAQPALRHGQQTTLYSQPTPGLFVIKRDVQVEDGKPQSLIVAFNTSEQAQPLEKIAALANAKLIYQSKGNEAGQLAGLSFAIYKP